MRGFWINQNRPTYKLFPRYSNALAGVFILCPLITDIVETFRRNVSTTVKVFLLVLMSADMILFGILIFGFYCRSLPSGNQQNEGVLFPAC
jgi:hypothetical protein